MTTEQQNVRRTTTGQPACVTQIGSNHQPPDETTSENQTTAIAALVLDQPSGLSLQAATNLLTTFAFTEPRRLVLQARVETDCSNLEQPIRISLLIVATRSTSAQAESAVREAAHDLGRYGRAWQNGTLRLVTDSAELATLMVPFSVRDAVEFGVQAAPSVTTREGSTTPPLWHQLPTPAWPRLLPLLVRIPHPAVFSMTMSASRLSDWELDALGRALAATSATTTDPTATVLASRAAVTVLNHAEARDARVPLYPPPLLEVGIWLASAGPISDIACGALLTALAGEGVALWRWRKALKPRELVQATSTLQTFSHDTIFEREEPASTARLPRLFTPGAAAALLPGVGFTPGGVISISTSDRNQGPNDSPVILGETEGLFGKVPVRLDWNDRLRHIYAPGQTGTGKSTVIANLALQDMQAGKAVVVIDPTGDLIADLLGRIPAERWDDVIVYDPSDVLQPLGLNILAAPTSAAARAAINELIGILYKVYDPRRTGMVGPRLENTFRCSLLSVLESGDEPTLLEVYRLLVDRDYEQRIARKVRDPYLHRYFSELAMTSDFHRSETVGYFASKLARFAADPDLRATLCQSQARWSLAEAMDNGKIVLASLNYGLLGPEASGFVGGLFLAKMMLAAFARGNRPTDQRPPVAVYLDEFQVYASDDAVARMLAGIRKYNVALCLANQHVHQLNEDVRSAIFGNVGTFVSLRVGAADAPLIAQALQPSHFDANDLVALPNFTAAVSLLHGGRRCPAFSLSTRALTIEHNADLAELLRQTSAEQYGRNRDDVDRESSVRLGRGGS